MRNNFKYDFAEDITKMYNLNKLTRPLDFKRARVSSYDITGGNADAWPIAPGETKVLADLTGPGVISHIWFTIASPDPQYLRKIALRIYWDGEENPSVSSPVGDFFGLGHSVSYTYSCALFSASTNSGEAGHIGDGVAMNCWVPMPFRKSARVEVTNEQDLPIHAFYFYVDYEKHTALPDDTLYFHAMWRRENPALLPEAHGDPAFDAMLRGSNLTDKYNYLILDTVGRGTYVGMNMSVDNLGTDWWGEGDDMFFIDRGNQNNPGEYDGALAWPPDLHGTGSEDYLAHAWGMQHTSNLHCGEPWCEYKEGNDHHSKGKVCVYRYHVADPVPFEKSLRVSIEHGHANDRANDISTVAYWYQDEPHKNFAPLPPAVLRLPR